jgi:hypothetical protein
MIFLKFNFPYEQSRFLVLGALYIFRVYVVSEGYG